jgi:hypothetical protein
MNLGTRLSLIPLDNQLAATPAIKIGLSRTFLSRKQIFRRRRRRRTRRKSFAKRAENKFLPQNDHFRAGLPDGIF